MKYKWQMIGSPLHGEFMHRNADISFLHYYNNGNRSSMGGAGNTDKSTSCLEMDVGIGESLWVIAYLMIVSTSPFLKNR